MIVEMKSMLQPQKSKVGENETFDRGLLVALLPFRRWSDFLLVNDRPVSIVEVVVKKQHENTYTMYQYVRKTQENVREP